MINMKFVPFPDQEILKAFGSEGVIRRLAGGEGASYSTGSMVLKHIDNVEEANWCAELMSSIVEDGFRVARPIMARERTWVYKGWTAYQHIEGQEMKGRYGEKIDLSSKFHKVLATCKRPLFMDTKSNPYMIADKMTWGDKPLTYSKQLETVLLPLTKLLKPLDLDDQLIHGDMTGNILFHTILTPAIIDMTPYWHPAEYAQAIIVVDSMVWDGADDALLKGIDNTFDMNQLLLRAVIWRIKITDELIQQGDQTTWDYINAYGHIAKLLFKRLK